MKILLGAILDEAEYVDNNESDDEEDNNNLRVVAGGDGEDINPILILVHAYFLSLLMKICRKLIFLKVAVK